MGVPSFYRWLVTKYPKIVCIAVEQQQAGADVDLTAPNPNGIEFDNLYLDMNGIVHPCFHPEDDEVAPTSYEEVFRNIFAYIDRLFGIVRPRKLLYLAIDGVAPRAKMNQQRSRRFRTAKEKQLAEAEEDRLRLEFEKQGKEVLPKVQSEVNDSNVITPGTVFMARLSEALNSYILSKMSTETSWKQIKVILSDANVPGEGEHKIMSFIRQQRADPHYNPNTHHCLYGLDADLIMLALSTHEVHFSLLREDVLVQYPQSYNAVAAQSLYESRGWFKNAVAPSKKSPLVRRKSYEFLHIWLLREYLELDMKIENLPANVDFEIERVVDDVVFMCFFAGNDFLPHMPTLSIHEGAIDLMLDIYKKEFKTRGGYLVEMSKAKDSHNSFIKLKRVEHFITSLGSREDQIFNKRSVLRERKIKQFLRHHSEPESCDAVHDYGLDVEMPFTQLSVCDDSEVLSNTKELQRKLKESLKKKSDLFRSGDIGVDRVRLGTVGWKKRYYAEKFLADTDIEMERVRTCVVEKYTEGLIWVLLYYYYGVPSWTWFFPFHYGPFASDLVGMSSIKVKFNKGSPLKPLDQLMAVLPPHSAAALPPPYWNLMTNEDSSIAEFHPEDFIIDVDGVRFSWQGIARLSFIDEQRLLSKTMELEKELVGEEESRNKVGNERLFSSTDSIVGERFNNNILRITSNPSEGFKRLSNCSSGLCELENVENAIVNCKDNDVLCMLYERLDDMVAPSVRLLDGVSIPVKTISETDIMETTLWHDNQGTRPRSTNLREAFGPNRNPAWSAGRGRGRGNVRTSSFSERPATSGRYLGRGARPSDSFWSTRNNQGRW